MKRKSILIGLLVVIVLSAIIYFRSYLQPELIKEFILGFGSFAIVAYIILYAIAMFIPMAGPIMSVTGGLVFGAVTGTIITVIVASVTSALPFLVSKKHGKKWVEEKVRGTKYEKVATKANNNSFLFVLYMRLIPVIPYELQNYIAGLSNITTGKFIVATFLGILPGTFALSFLGESITDIGSPKFWLAIGIFVIAIVVPILVNNLFKKK